MSIKIVAQRLRDDAGDDPVGKENRLKEIAQELALAALARTDFFARAAFLGGTCLRMYHGLQRFSEDLDFSLLGPDPHFSWTAYLKAMQTTLHLYGFRVEVKDRSELARGPVKIAFLKDSSVGKLLLVEAGSIAKGPHKALKIKVEIDTAPPAGANLVQQVHAFPAPALVTTFDLPSLFAGKSHALLCREWAKGRDWYDFVWYVGRKTPLNFALLTQAVQQLGPWRGQSIQVKAAWYIEQLAHKIDAVDWAAQRSDVIRFLKPADQRQLKLWSRSFFHNRLQFLAAYLQDQT